MRVLVSLVAAMTAIPANAALVFLDDSRVLDTTQGPSGVIWLAPRLTAGLGPNNVYTLSGWQMGSLPGEGPLNGDDPWVPGLFQNNFPDVLDPGNPYNPGVLELMTFLLGDSVHDYGQGGHHDYRARFDSCGPPTGVSGYHCFHYSASYSNYGDGSLWEFNQGGDDYTELDYQMLGWGDFWADQKPMLYQLAPVPVPAAAWLFGSALGVMGWMRRKFTE